MRDMCILNMLGMWAGVCTRARAHRYSKCDRVAWMRIWKPRARTTIAAGAHTRGALPCAHGAHGKYSVEYLYLYVSNGTVTAGPNG